MQKNPKKRIKAMRCEICLSCNIYTVYDGQVLCRQCISDEDEAYIYFLEQGDDDEKEEIA